jgi:outer membrane immunogenic protein
LRFKAYSGSAAQTKTGWTLGGGAEWALNRSWSVKAEYLYYDLGTINVTGLPPPPPVLGPIPFATQLSQKVTGSIARFGVNFMFGN